MPQARGEEEQQGSFFWTALQSVAIFIFIQFAMKSFTGGSKVPPGPASVNGSAVNPAAAQAAIPLYTDRPAPSEIQGNWSAIPQWIAPIWQPESTIDIVIYVSPDHTTLPLAKVPKDMLVLEEKNFGISSWDDSRDIQTSFPVPKYVQNNGTLWAHIYVAQSGSLIDPHSPGYDVAKAFYFAKPLNQFLKRKKVVKVRNLLSDATNEVEEEETTSDTDPVIASYYHPNFTLSVIPNSGTQSFVQMHPAVRDWVHIERTGARDITGQNSWYYPILYLNSFWQLRDHMSEINSTVTRLPLNIHLNHLSNWKFSIITSMDFGMKQQAEKASQGQSLTSGGDGSEFEQIKSILLDSNIYLLITTVIVSILHTVFEMLAFKNDVSHWRNKKDNVGVSVRTILANVFMQTVIFLYLMDNNENTSWMILMGQGMGILIEAWKITKTVNVRIRPTPANSTSIPWKYLPYTIVFEDKHKLSETEIKTQEYDQIAFKYMYLVGVPLIIAYAVYSLLYESHKSWYSFVITTLVGSVYAYGFLLMVPSLYINYRLKSVAHMPGKAMTYKVLSTFIDDLFAFTIKMPTLHRLATLRDDVIFFVYLYQSWKYKVDYTRVNEFGQGGDDDAPAQIDGSAKKETKGVDAVSSAAPATAVANGKAVKVSGRDAEGATKRK